YDDPLVLPSFPTRRSSDLKVCHGKQGWPNGIGRQRRHGIRPGRGGQTQQGKTGIMKGFPMKVNRRRFLRAAGVSLALPWLDALRSEEHTSELQSLPNLLCR